MARHEQPARRGLTSGKREFRDLLLRSDCPRPELDDAQLGQLERYLDALQMWNERMALVSQRDIRSIACKHFVDSLVAAAHCSATERVVDLGSGAGFPGLVIAIARPECDVCLIESRAKKVSFLLDVRRVCNLSKNVRVVHGRIEEVNQASEQGLHSLAVSRGLSRVETFVSLARPLLQAGGRLIAMKGPGAAKEISALEQDLAGVTLDERLPYRLPDGSPRELFMFHVKH